MLKMKNLFKLSLMISVTLVVTGCDPNAKAEFGSETGLPSNCRAYVQVAIDSYRAKQYTAEETFAGLERNCGQNGNLWSK